MSATVSPPTSRATEVCAQTHRAEKRLAEVRRMYSDGRPCMEVVEQLTSARATIDRLILRLLSDHVEKRLEPIKDGSQEGAQRLLVAISRHRKSNSSVPPAQFLVRIDRRDLRQ